MDTKPNIQQNIKNLRESPVRTINMKKLYEMFSNCQRGMVNMYHGRGGTYRIAEIMGIGEPREVEALWKEIASVRAGEVIPIRTLDYSIEELAKPIERPEAGLESIPEGATNEGASEEGTVGDGVTDEDAADEPQSLREVEQENEQINRPLSKKEKKELERQRKAKGE